MEENEIYEALGLEKPDQGQGGDQTDRSDAQGAREPGEGQRDGQTRDRAGDSAPAAEDDSQGEGESEPEMEPAEQEQEAPDQENEDSRERHPDQGQNQAPAITQAALEAAAAQAAARERARQERVLADFFRSANLRNPVTGEIIRDMAGLEAYNQAAETRRLERNLAEGKLTPEDIDALIRRRLEQRETQPQRGAAPASPPPGPAREAPQVTEEQVAAELSEIHRLDPTVNSLEDILKGPERDAFVTAVHRGNSFLDAFRLASFDRLQQQRQAEAAQRAAQAERSRIRSKEHMVPAGSRGQGAAEVPVPKEVMDLYRLMMPKAGEAEIRAHYSRAHAKDKDNI